MCGRAHRPAPVVTQLLARQFQRFVGGLYSQQVSDVITQVLRISVDSLHAELARTARRVRRSIGRACSPSPPSRCPSTRKISSASSIPASLVATTASLRWLPQPTARFWPLSMAACTALTTRPTLSTCAAATRTATLGRRRVPFSKTRAIVQSLAARLWSIRQPETSSCSSKGPALARLTSNQTIIT